jgi:hypothetical protein
MMFDFGIINVEDWYDGIRRRTQITFQCQRCPRDWHITVTDDAHAWISSFCGCMKYRHLDLW